MKRRADIKALLTYSGEAISKIEAEYKRSLHDHSISAGLKIEIKNLCGNLRSVLDYIAHDIRETYTPNATAKRFYFPIFPSQTSFESQMKKWFTGLDRTCPDLWHYFESIQPYQNGYSWLGHFNDLNNENKHGSLVEQIRTETERVHVSTVGGAQVNWNPAQVRFGPGVFIGGVPVNPQTQMPAPHPSQTVQRVTWIDFQFDGIGVSALKLLKQSFAGIRDIADTIEKMI